VSYHSLLKISVIGKLKFTRRFGISKKNITENPAEKNNTLAIL